jgi:hypothetical protein
MSFTPNRSDLLPSAEFEPYGNAATVAVIEPVAPVESNLPSWLDSAAEESRAEQKKCDAEFCKFRDAVAAGREVDAKRLVRLLASMQPPRTLEEFYASVQNRQARAGAVEQIQALPEVQRRHGEVMQAKVDARQAFRNAARAYRAKMKELDMQRSAAAVEMERLQGLVQWLRMGKPSVEERPLREQLALLQRERDSHQEAVGSFESSIVELKRAIPLAPREAVALNATQGSGDMPGIHGQQYSREHLQAALDLQQLRLKEAQTAVATANAKMKPVAARLAQIEAEQLLP